MHKKLKLCFQFMNLGSRYFDTLVEHISYREVIDNVKVIRYFIDSRIIYEFGTYTDAIRKFKIDVVNVQNLQKKMLKIPKG